jgi:hypothetical protein
VWNVVDVMVSMLASSVECCWSIVSCGYLVGVMVSILASSVECCWCNGKHACLECGMLLVHFPLQ